MVMGKICAMVMALRWRATKRVMAKGKGKGGKSAMARAARAMGTATKKVRSRATRLMPTATKKVMAMVAREGDGGKRDGDGD